MLEPFPNETTLHAAWEQLGVGAPTIVACALLCAKALHDGPQIDAELSQEAETLLWAARQRGMIEIKGVYTAFTGPARLLAVYVEQPDDTSLEFRCKDDVEFTVRCLEGFRQLCQHGFIWHHLFRDFSLSQFGFERAQNVDAEQAQKLIQRLQG
ncbi:MAG: hypothetical protein ABGX07_16240 [Pirellulaceae bacterium]|jgi:hypothetical protein|nr:hypothetical protein [Planctomycetaceae bacterium]HIM30354.1 hypothetical protein [Planctomycetota bacterium]